MPDIRLESVRCVYGAGTPFEKVALDNIDLSIPAGQYAALLGHTGSGKSTLIQHLNGLLKPASGRVLLGEEDIHRSKEALRQTRFQVGRCAPSASASVWCFSTRNTSSLKRRFTATLRSVRKIWA